MSYREEFEKWVRTEMTGFAGGVVLAADLTDSDWDYFTKAAEVAWRAWQAARAQDGGLCHCNARQDLLEIHRVAAHIAGVELPTEDDQLTVKRVKQMAMLINQMSGWLDEARAQGGEAVVTVTNANSKESTEEPVATMSARDWLRLSRLPPGTKLYTHPSAKNTEKLTDLITTKDEYIGFLQAQVKQFKNRATTPHLSASVPDPDLQVIEQRDYWEEKATELAEDVGKHFGFEVGEHSSANCPVQTAIDQMGEIEAARSQGGESEDPYLDACEAIDDGVHALVNALGMSMEYFDGEGAQAYETAEGLKRIAAMLEPLGLKYDPDEGDITHPSASVPESEIARRTLNKLRAACVGMTGTQIRQMLDGLVTTTPQPAEKTCTWTEDEGMWNSECGYGLWYEDGTPSECGQKYCPKCGKPCLEVLNPPAEGAEP